MFLLVKWKAGSTHLKSPWTSLIPYNSLPSSIMPVVQPREAKRTFLLSAVIILGILLSIAQVTNASPPMLPLCRPEDCTWTPLSQFLSTVRSTYWNGYSNMSCQASSRIQSVLIFFVISDWKEMKLRWHSVFFCPSYFFWIVSEFMQKRFFFGM